MCSDRDFPYCWAGGGPPITEPLTCHGQHTLVIVQRIAHNSDDWMQFTCCPAGAPELITGCLASRMQVVDQAVASSSPTCTSTLPAVGQGEGATTDCDTIPRGRVQQELPELCPGAVSGCAWGLSGRVVQWGTAPIAEIATSAPSAAAASTTSNAATATTAAGRRPQRAGRGWPESVALSHYSRNGSGSFVSLVVFTDLTGASKEFRERASLLSFAEVLF
eukprot:1822714-Prymnesium_polylepis.1